MLKKDVASLQKELKEFLLNKGDCKNIKEKIPVFQDACLYKTDSEKDASKYPELNE